MAEETQDKMQVAVNQENEFLNATIRQYLEGRVVELNIKNQELEEKNAELEAAITELKPAEDGEKTEGD
jgi:hypothetical protein